MEESSPAQRRSIPAGWLVLAIFCLFASLTNAFLLAPAYSDLHPVWTATRAFLLHHESPYSSAVTEENSRSFHAASNDHPDYDLRFAYPLPDVLLFAPFALLPFGVAQLAMFLIGFALTAASFRWWTGQFHLIPLMLFLAAYPVMLGLQIEQPTILFAAIIAAAIRCMKTSKPIAAGILLSLALGKPQLAIFVLVPVLAWCLSDWKQGRKLVIALTASSIALLIPSFLLQPRWFSEWMTAMAAYSHYAGTSLPSSLFGKQIGFALCFAILAIGLLSCWQTRKQFDLNLNISIATCSLILPFQGYNEIMLLAPLAWIWAHRSELKETFPLLLTLVKISIAELFVATSCAPIIAALSPAHADTLQQLLGGLTKIVPVTIFAVFAGHTLAEATLAEKFRRALRGQRDYGASGASTRPPSLSL